MVSTLRRWVTPVPGFWHSHPMSVQLHQCPLGKAACNYGNRTVNLTSWAQARRYTYFNESELYEYLDLQCSTGYTSNACGRCA